MKFLEDNMGKAVQDIGIGDYFLGKTSKTRERKEKQHKWDHIKLRYINISIQAKETIELRSIKQNGRKIFAANL